MIPGKEKSDIASLKKVRSLDVRVGTITLYEGSLLIFRFHDEVTILVSDIIEISEKNIELTKHAMYFSMVVPGSRNDLSKEAREFDFYKELNRKPTCIAEAIIIRDLPTRIVADFYYKFRKFPYPTQVFSKEEKALDWFRSINPAL